MVANFQALLAGLIHEPDLRLSELPFLSAEERGQVLAAAVPTVSVPPAFLEAAWPPAAVERWARQAGTTIAVVAGEQRLTYAELNAREPAGALPAAARVGPEVRAGIRMTRSVELVVGLLGILKAGGAIVPLDVRHPGAWRDAILEEARPALVLTEKALLRPEGETGLDVVALDSTREAIDREAADNLSAPGDLDQLAHVNCSTSRGVLLTRRGMANRLAWLQQAFPLTVTDGMLHQAPLSLDVALVEIFWPLTQGGRDRGAAGVPV